MACPHGFASCVLLGGRGVTYKLRNGSGTSQWFLDISRLETSFGTASFSGKLCGL